MHTPALKCHVGRVLNVTQWPGLQLSPSSLSQYRCLPPRSGVRRQESCFGLIFTPTSDLRKSCAPPGPGSAAVPRLAALCLGLPAGAQAVLWRTRMIPTEVSEALCSLHCPSAPPATLPCPARIRPQGTCRAGRGEAVQMLPLQRCLRGMFPPVHPWDMLWLSRSDELAACSAALLLVCQQAPACTPRSGRDLENSVCLCIESETSRVPNPALPLARASPHLYAEHARLSFRSRLQCFPTRTDVFFQLSFTHTLPDPLPSASVRPSAVFLFFFFPLATAMSTAHVSVAFQNLG